MKNFKPIVCQIIFLFSIQTGYCCGCSSAPATFCGSANEHQSVVLVKFLEADTILIDLLSSTKAIQIWDVLILEDFADKIPQDTIRMPSGGFSCNVDLESLVSTGDTLFLNIHHAGQVIPEDYGISFCGRNWLRYRNDTLYGPIYPGINNLSLNDFRQSFNACLDAPPDFLMANYLLKGDTTPVGSLSILFNDTLQSTNEEGIFNYYFFAKSGFNRRTVFFSKKDEQQRGLSTQDLMLIQKHILGVDTLRNPYQLLAADVNQSGTISILDLIQVQRLILGKRNSFQQGRDWLFIPAAYRFEDPQKPWDSPMPSPFILYPFSGVQYERIVMIKVGDVDFSF